MENYICETPCGKVNGCMLNEHVVAYKGIHYATAGRWEYPVVMNHWEGVSQATEFGDACIQDRTYRPEQNSGRPFYYNEFRKDIPFTYSEDCMVLNVFAPVQAKKAPVIVYIHGGAFLGGSSDELCFRTPAWIKLGVIAVTINYRVGPFGYLCLPELVEEAGHTGNYGFYDQLAALQWIHSNIEAFGGDPENVTVMGQSAGAMSVQHLVSSHAAEGLMHRAVLSSGGGRVRWAEADVPMDTFYDFWWEVLHNAGANTLEEARTLPAPALMDAFGQMLMKDFMKNRASCGFVVDGVAMPKSFHEVMEAGEQMKIPYLIGSNSDDMATVSMQEDVQEWLTMQEIPSYGYFFSRQLPGDQSGAFHSADLWYWFGTLHDSWRPMEQQDDILSDEMTRYLANFAKTGNPNGEGLPQWNNGNKTREVMHFSDTDTKMVTLDSVSLIKDRTVTGW
ncbi:carboxylesterase type B [Lachnospiraceae bacterium PM6-15]|uniref:carboxylesterase/lipase family protein n=1 Tax=Ohessyouella blattaphilus TaxID=2949333 RepID=UPI003E1C72D2